MKTFFRVLLILLVLAGVAWGATWYFHKGSGSANPYVTTQIKRGDLTATINATGTLEPQEAVDVGAQVSGQISEFGKDTAGQLVDRRSVVKEGMILAKIDDSLYQADLATAQAMVTQANASVQHAVADLGQMQATLNQAQANWDRAQKAGVGNGVLSQEVYDQYKAAYEIGKANISVGQAAIEEAKGSVAQAQAGLIRAQHNVDYCIIKSPVDGEIIDRRVNIGQTVASSLNTPSLFLIAEDLKKMKVWASVNEADIGSIQPGQPVTYSVDAFPNRTFKGTVSKVWLNANMTQNVVTYTVEISADNSDGKLLPYMTANILFQVATQTGVLQVPNAALRYSPQEDQIAPDARSAANGSGGSGGAGDNSSGGGGGNGGGANGGNSGGQPASGEQRHSTTRPSSGSMGGMSHERGTLWARDGQYVRPIRVRVGLSDGANTGVEGKDLTEGTEVVIGDAQPADASSAGGKNPFIPQFGNRRRGGAGGGGGGGGR